MELIIGFILDLIIGDFNNLYYFIRGIGLIVNRLEKFFRIVLKNLLRFVGLIVWMFIVGIMFLIMFGIVYIVKKLNVEFGMIVEGILIYFCILFKGLVVEGYKVIWFLVKNDIESVRK